ncbi:hypothetical protein GCM10023116_33640 [Kistimonas scapharcae]|uniref:Uncharacterized protein n=1 Tax=Kistimonas scapharcae TaxID=1036133 RepID=A0ABP8V700_9GAMM
MESLVSGAAPTSMKVHESMMERRESTGDWSALLRVDKKTLVRSRSSRSISSMQSQSQRATLKVGEHEIALPQSICPEKNKLHREKIDAMQAAISGIMESLQLVDDEFKKSFDCLCKVVSVKSSYYQAKEENDDDNDDAARFIAACHEFFNAIQEELEDAVSIDGKSAEPGARQSVLVRCSSETIQRLTVLLFSAPEFANAVVLKQYFSISLTEKNKNCGQKAIFEKLEELQYQKLFKALNQSEDVLRQYDLRYQSTGVPKVAALFKVLDVDISTEDNEFAKPVRRFDKFCDKAQRLMVETAKNMAPGSNVTDIHELGDHCVELIATTSAVLTGELSRKGWLLEAAEFSYLKEEFDDKVCSLFRFLISEISPDIRERIGPDVMALLSSLPRKVKQHISGEVTKPNIRKAFIAIQKEMIREIVCCLDKQVMMLDGLFRRNGQFATRLSLTESNPAAERAVEHADHAPSAARRFKWDSDNARQLLEQLDEIIDSEEHTSQTALLKKKLAIRTTLIDGMSDLNATLTIKLEGTEQTYLYDLVSIRVAREVGRQFNLGITKKNLSADLAIKQAFATTEATLPTLIGAAENEYINHMVKGLERCVKEGQNTVATYRPSAMRLRSKPRAADTGLAMVNVNSCDGKTLSERLDRTQKILTIIRSQLTLKEIGDGGNQHQASLPSSSPQAALKGGHPKIHGMSLQDINKLLGLAKAEPSPSILRCANGIVDAVAGGLKSIYANYLETPEFSIDERYLLPVENIRVKNLTRMTPEHCETLKLLCQCALEKTCIVLKSKLASDPGVVSTVDRVLGGLVESVASFKLISSINVFSFYEELFDAVAMSTMEELQLPYLDLKEALKKRHDKLKNLFNAFLRGNFLKESHEAWNVLLKRYETEFSERGYKEVFDRRGINLPKNRVKQLRVILQVMSTEFISVFSVPLSGHPLPPSHEMVALFQQLMPLRIGQAFPERSVTDYRIAIEAYNNFLTSKAEQLSHDRISEVDDRTAQIGKSLGKTAKKAEKMLAEERLRELILECVKLQGQPQHKATVEKYQQALNKFISHVSKSEKAKNGFFWVIHKIQNGCDRYAQLITGLFIGSAGINMFFTGKVTGLMRVVQEYADRLFVAGHQLQPEIQLLLKAFQELEVASPGILNRIHDAYVTLSANATEAAETCSNTIYKLLAPTSAVNATTIANASNTALALLEDVGQNSVGLLGALRYEILDGCPAGGLDSFPTDTFINWGNGLTSFFSIFTGALACTTGWVPETKQYVANAKRFFTLPNAYQELSPHVCEDLLEVAAKRLPGARLPSGAVMGGIYHPTTFLEKALDTIEAAFHKKIKYEDTCSKANFMSKVLWLVRYLTIGPASHTMPPRPHGIDHLLEMLENESEDRMIKTLIRMLIYNSMKELMDVFSTKEATLILLIAIKETDIHVAANEKAAIARFMTLRSYFSKILSIRLSKPFKPDESVVNMLRDVLGHEMTDNLVGPEELAISRVEKSRQTLNASRLYRLAGGVTVLGTYVGFGLNLAWYTITPYNQAHALVYSGLESPLGDEALEKAILKKAQKTMSREYDPLNLDPSTKFWHTMYAARGYSDAFKVEQTLFHLGLKEACVWSMLLNSRGHERSILMNATNYEINGITYLSALKELTGILSRGATLSGDETFRTGASAIDKVDSILVEYGYPLIASKELRSPQMLINTLKDLIEDVITASSGDIEEIMEAVDYLVRKLSSIGINCLELATEILEGAVQDQLAVFKGEVSREPLPDVQDKTARNMEGQYQKLLLQFNKQLQSKLVAYGKPVDSEFEAHMEEIEKELDVFRSPDFDPFRPENFLFAMTMLEGILPDEDAADWVAHSLLHQVRHRTPGETQQKRVRDLEAVSAMRNRQVIEHGEDMAEVSSGSEVDRPSDTMLKSSAHGQLQPEIVVEPASQSVSARGISRV